MRQWQRSVGALTLAVLLVSCADPAEQARQDRAFLADVTRQQPALAAQPVDELTQWARDTCQHVRFVGGTWDYPTAAAQASRGWTDRQAIVLADAAHRVYCPGARPPR